jgi:hypothetical protein
LELSLVLVVVGLAIVQSVFGVGLLVFGTPALLLLGLTFEETLAYLLPSSIVISVLQVVAGGGFRLDPMRRQFLIYTAPLVLVGAASILTVGVGVDIRLLVGALLIVSGAIRLLGPTRVAVSRLIRHRLPVFLVLLGVIHGVSNLGGGILTLIVGSVYDDKEDVRRQIAFCYAMMASIQLITLSITSRTGLVPLQLLILPVLAGVTYIFLGNRAFRAASQDGYQLSLAVLIVVFGLVLIAGI